MTRMYWCALLVAGASLATLVACSEAGELPELPEGAFFASTEEVPDVLLVRRMVEHFHVAQTIRMAQDGADRSVPTTIEAKRLADGSIITRMEFIAGGSTASIYLFHCSLEAETVYWYQLTSDSQNVLGWDVSTLPVDDSTVPAFASEYPESLFFESEDAGTRTVDGEAVRGLTSDRTGAPATFWLTEDDRLTLVELESVAGALTSRFEYDVALDLRLPEVPNPPTC